MLQVSQVLVREILVKNNEISHDVAILSYSLIMR